MPIKKFRPVTASLRFRAVPTFEEITTSVPERSLIQTLRKTGGRNNKGRVTNWNTGGGHRRQYRMIDFKRHKHDIPARVASIEYDPNRSARIALLHYADGEKRYIIAPNNLKVNDTVISGQSVDNRIGNAMPLSQLLLGTEVHNIEIRPGKGAQICRSAGSFAQIVAKEGGKVSLRMPSGEVRTVPESCFATIGQVSNLDHKNIVLGKAGASRWRGIRPSVRGVAMNPVDHPMGGGEGRTSGGRHPVTPWGKKTKGLKTRKRKKSLKHLVQDRRVKI